jgi:hypothetical protein
MQSPLSRLPIAAHCYVLLCNKLSMSRPVL